MTDSVCSECGAPISIGGDGHLCPACFTSRNAEQTASENATEILWKPHRARQVLIWAASAYVVCFFPAIVAYLMARRDLKEMAAGRMDPAGRRETEAARILAITNLLLHVVIGIAIVVGVGMILWYEYTR